LARVEEQRRAWGQGVARQPAGTAEAGALAGWRAAYEALAAEVRAAADDEEGALREEAAAAEEAAHLAARLEQARAARPRWEGAVRVQLDAPRQAPVALELVYRTPCALWRPEHQATLATDGAEAASG